MVGREGLENRRIVWITLWGKCYPSQCRREQEARGSTRAVLRAKKGEGSHVAVTGTEVGDGWAWSCSMKTIKQVRREKQKPVQKGNHGLSATRFRSEQDSQTEQSSGSNRKDDGREEKRHTHPSSPTSMKEG